MARRRQIILGETIEEKQARIRRESAQRIRILSVIAVIAIGARIAIKDPVKPPPPVHNVPIKIMPGMLAALPPSERAKLDPQLIARLMLADEQAKQKKNEMLAALHSAGKNAGPYKPAPRIDTPIEAEESTKEHLYAYSKRQKVADEVKEKLKQDETRKAATLVRFSNGGNLRVDLASRDKDGVTVRMAGVAARFPDRMVASVMQNAGAWEEPVPADKIKFKPARGITVILDRDTARRVTVKKQVFDEI